jgi:hypothetical protein
MNVAYTDPFHTSDKDQKYILDLYGKQSITARQFILLDAHGRDVNYPKNNVMSYPRINSGSAWNPSHTVYGLSPATYPILGSKKNPILDHNGRHLEEHKPGNWPPRYIFTLEEDRKAREHDERGGPNVRRALGQREHQLFHRKKNN